MDRNEQIIDALLARIEEIKTSAGTEEAVHVDLQSELELSRRWHGEYTHAVQHALGMDMSIQRPEKVVAAIEALKKGESDGE